MKDPMHKNEIGQQNASAFLHYLHRLSFSFHFFMFSHPFAIILEFIFTLMKISSSCIHSTYIENKLGQLFSLQAFHTPSSVDQLTYTLRSVVHITVGKVYYFLNPSRLGEILGGSTK